MSDKIGSLRRGQLVSSSGPGALVDMRAANGAPVSVLVRGLDAWDKSKCAPLAEPSLQRRLGNRELREPPVSIRDRNKDQPSVPALRFPRWLECPACHSLKEERRWREDGVGRYCGCVDGRKTYAVPALLVRGCRHGHLDEFEWDRWVRHREGCKSSDLWLRSSGAGLRDLYVNCRTCGAGQSLNNAFVSLIECSGRLPWIDKDAREPCGGNMETLQRGASNVYFAATLSALSIPPWTDEFREKVVDPGHWERIVDAFQDNEDDPQGLDTDLAKLARRISRDSDPPISVEDAGALVRKYADAYRDVPTDRDGDRLRLEEWHQIRIGAANGVAEETFEVRAEVVPQALTPFMEEIARLPRLREVRVLTGFTRIALPEDGVEHSSSLARKARWLPAIETHGEGIFVALREDAVARWAADPAVAARAAKLDAEWAKARGNRAVEDRITPRRLLVHAFAHALMTQLSLSCGYSAASIRERLYYGDDPVMAGVLIYTAAADSDGTLGGLEREGRSERIGATILAAIRSMWWCSSDPSCIAGVATTTDPTNGAACHSCLMIPETSCESFNRFLDRVALVGLDGGTAVERLPGFFSNLI